MPTTKQVKKYHRRKKGIKKVILRKTGRKEIIYGARALNAYFPPFLDKPTQDFDIFSPTPKKDAKQTERALDKHMGFDAFGVRQAKHPQTWKVRSKVTRSGVADYTKPEQRIPSRKIGKHRYVKLSYVKKHIRKTLKDPEAKFRHDKDRADMDRIKVYESLQKRTRRKVRVSPFNKTITRLNRLKRGWGI